jgi:zinc transport system substrate-binding protein
MKKILLIMFALNFLIFSGCQGKPETIVPPDSQQTQSQKSERLKIVTSFYPLYEIAKRVGGNKVEVINLVPPGSEPHDFEPTPQDMVALTKADLVLINGSGMEPWAERIIPELQKKGISVLNQSDLFQGLTVKNEDTEGEHTEEHEEHFPYDPHFWLDPLLYLNEVNSVSRKLIQLDPQNAQTYEQNTKAFTDEIKALHYAFENGLKTCKQREIVTAHAAFAYLAKRYNLEMIPITGVSPEAEPSPKVLADLSKLIKEKGIKYIFTETLVSPKVAETLAIETGAKTLVFNPIEGLSEKEITDGENYISIMKNNLKNLQMALECSEERSSLQETQGPYPDVPASNYALRKEME